jgi:hypothetical protein
MERKMMSELRKVKIEYDGGAPYGAKVTDADTGETIPSVYRVDFTLDASDKGVPVVTLYSYMPIINVIAHASIHEVCPYCNQEVSNKDREESGNDTR